MCDACFGVLADGRPIYENDVYINGTDAGTAMAEAATLANLMQEETANNGHTFKVAGVVQTAVVRFPASSSPITSLGPVNRHF